jgi:hypothetical protein
MSTLIVFAVVEPTFNHLYICPVMPYCSTMLRYTNLTPVQ